MARSFSSLRSFATIICLAAAATAVCAFQTVRRAVTAACSWVIKLAAAPFKPEPMRALPGLAVQLLQAKQYLLRQIKRERPNMTPGWRMAPST